MEHGCGVGGKAVPGERFLAKDIGHLRIRVPFGGPERPASNRPDVVLKLADGAGVDRPMAGVVHARGEFVDDQALPGRETAAKVEHLDGQHPDVVERRGDRRGNAARLLQVGRGHARGHDRAAQNALCVHIVGAVIECELACRAARPKQQTF